MSKYEQTLAEIEDFIDNCKRAKLSSSSILVNKEQMEEYISELRIRTPEEIKKYQRIISNRDAILNAAQAQAADMIEQAKHETNELISEHEIMQQAYVQANEIVQKATNQAQAILDSAMNDANNIRTGAMQYTDDILGNLQNIITHSMDNITDKYNSYMKSLQTSLDVVVANRNELNPPEEPDLANLEASVASAGASDENDEYEDYTVQLDI